MSPRNACFLAGGFWCFFCVKVSLDNLLIVVFFWWKTLFLLLLFSLSFSLLLLSNELLIRERREHKFLLYIPPLSLSLDFCFPAKTRALFFLLSKRRRRRRDSFLSESSKRRHDDNANVVGEYSDAPRDLYRREDAMPKSSSSASSSPRKRTPDRILRRRLEIGDAMDDARPGRKKKRETRRRQQRRVPVRSKREFFVVRGR